MESLMTQDEIIELFEYHGGNLWWRERLSNCVDMSKPAGCVDTYGGYRLIGINGKHYGAHRLIWLYHYGCLPEVEIDHIDNNKTNNNIDNLREATRNQQNYNRSLQKNNTSGHKGVSWDERSGKWRAYITINYKHKHLGYFYCKEEAHKAYCKAANKLYDEFANYGK
jgi:hypothetical protein